MLTRLETLDETLKLHVSRQNCGDNFCRCDAGRGILSGEVLGQPTVWLRGGIIAALILSFCGVAPAQESPGAQEAAKNQHTAASTAALDRMVDAGKSPRELAQYLFDSHGCKDCHTIGQQGKLGL